MATWGEFAKSEPDLAQRIKARFDSHKHKMLATLRKDGSPRLSGIEATFADGQLWLGMMTGSMKALDLRRDDRFALHVAPIDTEMAGGDAKLAGRAIEHTSDKVKTAFSKTLGEAGQQMPDEPFHLFSVDIQEAVLIRLGEPANHLVIETWREGRGLTRTERR